MKRTIEEIFENSLLALTAFAATSGMLRTRSLRPTSIRSMSTARPRRPTPFSVAIRRQLVRGFAMKTRCGASTSRRCAQNCYGSLVAMMRLGLRTGWPSTASICTTRRCQERARSISESATCGASRPRNRTWHHLSTIRRTESRPIQATKSEQLIRL